MSILKGFSHDLSFLETDDIELESIRKFEKALQKLKNYETPAGMKHKVGYFNEPNNKLHVLNKFVECTKNQFVHNISQCNDSENIYQPGDEITHRNK